CKSYPVTLETLAHARAYILANPVRGLLVEKPEDWDYAGTPTPLPVRAAGNEPPRYRGLAAALNQLPRRPGWFPRPWLRPLLPLLRAARSRLLTSLSAVSAST